jgi:hypothetical protein
MPREGLDQEDGGLAAIVAADERYAMWVSDDKGLKIKGGEGKVYRFENGKLELRGVEVEEFEQLSLRAPIIFSRCRRVNLDEAERIVRAHMATRRAAATAGVVTSGLAAHAHAELARRDEEMRKEGIDPEKFRGEGLTMTESRSSAGQVTQAQAQPERTTPPPVQPGNLPTPGAPAPSLGNEFTDELQRAKDAQSLDKPKTMGSLFKKPQ